MDLNDKINLVKNILFERKDEYLNTFDILNKTEGKITEGELDTILIHLLSTEEILKDYVRDRDGGALYTLFMYKLSVKSLLEMEKEQKGIGNSVNETAKYSLPQIALGYQYLRLQNLHKGIDEENRDEIAKKYLWVSKDSGRKLHDYYKNLFQESERVTPRLSDNSNSKNTRVNHIKGAINLLQEFPDSKNSIELAEKELIKIQEL